MSVFWFERRRDLASSKTMYIYVYMENWIEEQEGNRERTRLRLLKLYDSGNQVTSVGLE